MASSAKIAALFLCLSIILSSCYFFPSGLPQPTDFLSLIGFIFLIVNPKILKFLTQQLFARKFLIGFLSCFIIANIYSLRFYPDVTFWGAFLGIAYIIFNLAIYLSFNFFSKEISTYPMFLNSCLLCAFIDFISTYVQQGLRGSGFMNNPNQFGSHILSLLIISILFSKSNLVSWKTILIFALLITPAIQTGSKAALVGGIPIIISVAFSLIFNIKRNLFLLFEFLKNKSLYILIILVMASVVLFMFPEQVEKFINIFSNALDFTNQRIESSVNESDSDLWHGRNIYLITKLTWIDWFTGIGYYRYYQRLGETFEIHSLFPSLIVISGVFSFIFFTLFVLFRLKRNINFLAWSSIFSLVLYSITHQLFRDTNMWIILGLMR
ncbi:hypothetical protein [Synechocystis sp. LKSZ1]|uniref:hypothetical protein n=1 Tax=Synechocystis sp. LKSZ1 TaxID=3144951 RepID=UPI00336BB777